jgi:5-methyltetrahydropteroyltriglutamate--homocysteine methyltransferase
MSSRILTTHAGSLPRPADLDQMMTDHDRNQLDPSVDLRQRIAEATAEVVRRQIDMGINIPSDGEYPKPSYAAYVKQRLSGFEGPPHARSWAAVYTEFPDWVQQHASPVRNPTNDGPVTLRDPSQVRADIANLKLALEAAGARRAFMSAASPGVIESFMPSSYYATDRGYLEALGAAMSDEYKTIVDAGFILQLDCPDLAMSRAQRFSHLSDSEFRAVARMHVDVLNSAIDGLPRSMTRLHLCWGNHVGPHTHDVPLADVLDLVLEANVGALVFESANPRHAHEWKLFKRRLPPDLVLIPGVIDTGTVYVEHPEVVADRLLRFIDIVGPDRVIGGTDCGFASSIGSRLVPQTVAWAKLQSLVDGAAMAAAAL